MLRAQFDTQVRPPSDVATGMCKAGDDSAPDRIGGQPNNYGYGRGGLLGGEGRGSGGGCDDVYFQADEISCESCELIGVPLGEPDLQDNVLALDSPELAEPLPECIQIEPLIGGRSVVQVPDLANLPRALRLGGERRGEEATGQGTEERPTFHYSIT